MPEAPQDPRVGTVLQGRYRIDARLGAGGMGVVYRGERVGLGRLVAIKFLHRDIADNPEFRDRFEREARAMSKLHHPHCVPVIDFGVDDQPYIVLEYVTGVSLSSLLGRPLPVPRVIAIMRQILSALAHAHELGIVHRDIKPDNVILADATGTGDHARVFDFGLAKMKATPASWATGAVAVGTPSYMSPEQARGDEVDARADLYSCGVLLFQMLTGRKPFVADTALEILRKHVEVRPPKLGETVSGRQFGPELEAVVASALAKDPAKRHASAMVFADALGAIAAGEPSTRERSVRAQPDVEPDRDGADDLAAPAPPSAVQRGGIGLGTILFWTLVLAVIAGLALLFKFVPPP